MTTGVIGGGVYGGGAIASAPTFALGSTVASTGVYGGGVIGALIVETFGAITMGAPMTIMAAPVVSTSYGIPPAVY